MAQSILISPDEEYKKLEEHMADKILNSKRERNYSSIIKQFWNLD